MLDSTFSDEHGDFLKGTFVLNPDGTRHTSYSKDGYVLLVKLRQYPGTEREHVCVNTLGAPWRKIGIPGFEKLRLYENMASGEAGELCSEPPCLLTTRHISSWRNTPSRSRIKFYKSVLMKAALPLNKAAKSRLHHWVCSSGSVFISSTRYRT